MNAQTHPNYNMDVVKLFTLATCFWGVVGMLVGVIIALQLACLLYTSPSPRDPT